MRVPSFTVLAAAALLWGASANAKPLSVYTTTYVGEQVGQNSLWHVVGCQPSKSLTLYYDDGRNRVLQNVQVNGTVSYSIAKVVQETNGDDLHAMADTITLHYIDQCLGEFWFN